MKDRVLPIATAVMIVTSLYLTLVWAPTEASMGIVQRIFYTHVPPFFVAFVSIFVGMYAAIRYLMTRDLRFDELSVASIEVGWVFDTMNLFTGPFWARPVWGIWWTWDPRLTSAFVLWLMFVGYLILRRAIEDPDLRARVLAVVTVFQAINSLIVYMAIRWWRTQHPQPVMFSSEGSLDPRMRFVLWFSFAALMFLFVYLVGIRRRLERLRHETEGLRRTVHAM